MEKCKNAYKMLPCKIGYTLRLNKVIFRQFYKLLSFFIFPFESLFNKLHKHCFGYSFPCTPNMGFCQINWNLPYHFRNRFPLYAWTRLNVPVILMIKPPQFFSSFLHKGAGRLCCANALLRVITWIQDYQWNLFITKILETCLV